MKQAKLCIVLAWATLLAGCAATNPHPPQTVAEMDHYNGSQEYTDRTTALHNVNRVMSRSLSPEQRIESLRVLDRLQASNIEIYPALAAVLAEPETPLTLRESVLAFLISRDYPGLGEHISAALPTASDDRLRGAILDWLIRHPSPTNLAQIAKMWALEKSRTGDTELRYRRVVEQMSGTSWDQALLNGLNTEEFFARGSALEVLAARIPVEQLRTRIMRLPARTDPVKAMQYFSERFGYLPTGGRELMAEVTAFRNGPERLTAAMVLAYEWQKPQFGGYRFNIRDTHLLMRLANDPLRKMQPREKLVNDLAAAINSRHHTAPAAGQRNMDFRGQLEGLSMADLWNLTLLNEMLSQSSFRAALQNAIAKDQPTRQGQLGGLISYSLSGRAEAKLYRPGERRGDELYTASSRMIQDSLDCLCYFVEHYQSDNYIGPTQRELEFAHDYNLCGAILTTLSKGGLAAVYFTPAGTPVDLGEFGDGAAAVAKK